MKGMGFFYAIAAAILWGLLYTILHKIVTKISPINLLVLTYSIGLAITLPIALVKTSLLSEVHVLERMDLLLLVASVALSVLGSLAIYLAIQILGAPIASVFEIAYPFFVVIFSAVFIGFKIHPPFILGALLIFLGSYIVMRFS